MERKAHLVDAALLSRNLRNRLAEDKDMVDADGGDTSNDGFGNDVGRVVGSSNSDFEDSSVDLVRTAMSRSEGWPKGRRTFSCRKTWNAISVK